MTMLAAGALLCAGAVGLAGCAPEPSGRTAGADPDASAQPTETVEVAESLETTRTGSGELVSPDGLTTGRVEVRLHDETDDFGHTEPMATVEFFDLVSPHDRLVVGGYLEPRGDDPCFDLGHRSAAATVTPGAHRIVDDLPAAAMGYEIYEFVLHLEPSVSR